MEVTHTKYVLGNSKGEFVEKIDTENGILILTKDVNKAYDYDTLRGGGAWNADNYKEFITFHFNDEFGERVTTLKPMTIFIDET